MGGKSFRTILLESMQRGRLLVIPGIHDALSARIAEQTGFETLFVGGFPVVGARYGIPDVGLAGLSDIADAVADIQRATTLPMLVDMDDGYGDVKNAVHSLHRYETMGISAIFMEDQALPKRCGHMTGKRVVPMQLMEAKLKAVLAERMNPETMICARSDSRAPLGFEEALRRADRCVELGAEGIFVEAPESLKELEILGRRYKGVPQFANPLIGGKTPILSPQELEQLGFNAIPFGLDTIMHAAKAIKTILTDLKSGAFARRKDGMPFEEFKTVVGYDMWDRIDNTYGVEAGG